MTTAQNQLPFDLSTVQMQKLWDRFNKIIHGFKDFENPGDDFVKNETAYKRAILKKFQEELGAEKLSALVAQGQGTLAAQAIDRDRVVERRPALRQVCGAA